MQCKSGPGGNDMINRRDHLLHHFFDNNSPPPHQFLREKILLKKLAKGNAY